MKSKNVEMLVLENEELLDLLEDILTWIQDIREEMATELDDLENMIVETRRMRQL